MKRTIYIMCAAYMMCALIMFCGCKSTRYVESPAVYALHDTIRQTVTRTDSVLCRDSVYVEGDKVYKERTVYSVRIVHDTLYATRTDTIRVPAPQQQKESTITSSLPWYDEAFRHIGRMCVIALLLWIIFLYIKRKF